MLSLGEAIAVVEAAYDLDRDYAEWMRSLGSAFSAAIDHGLGGTMHWFDARTGSLLCDASAQALGEAALGRSGLRRGSAKLRVICQSAPRFVVASEEAIPTHEARWLAGIGGWHARTRDVIMLVASGAQGSGWIVAAPTARTPRISVDQRERWQRVAAQIGAAGRLRNALVGSWASGSPRPRDRLRAAARASLEGQAGWIGAPANAGSSAWQALADGRWSIVDQFEADGRRVIVVQRNTAAALDPRALTEREREAALLAARGRAGKYIAYELGLSTPTVSQLLRRAVRKLGMQGVAELGTTIRALAAPLRRGTFETNN
jgi:DNA-binding CsgD family transcriptional regulator